MKLPLTSFLIILAGVMFAQSASNITLNECLKRAVEHYPSIRQFELNREIAEVNTKIIGTKYYPTLNLFGQMHYQSDVTKVPTIIPEFAPPEIPKDWYKLNLDIEQMIYDGGHTSGQKQLEQAKLAVTDQKVEIELYRLKERVTALFFNIIFLDKQIRILRTLNENLAVRIDEAEKAYRNGVLLSADVDALRVEQYNSEQKIIEVAEDTEGLLQSLSEYIALEIPSAAQLVLPDPEIESYGFENNRPEYILYNKQQAQVASLRSLVQAKRRPVFQAFGQLGYGRPGYDMLNENFDDYYMVGLRLQWNIWDWGKVKRQKHVYDLQDQIIVTTKETFDQNLRSDLRKRLSDIRKYEKIIGSDETIVGLQQNVVNTADKQLKNGTITSTGYLIEVNKLVKANLNLEAHKLQLIYARYQYLAAIGNL
jgi:outer membrane protein TolC